jgi:anti-sigma factor RsiW
MTSFTDEELVGYLDGQIEPTRWNEIDTALAQDPALAARLVALEIDDGALIAAFDQVTKAAPVDRLRARLNAKGLDVSAPRASAPTRLPRWAAIAAALIAGLALGYIVGASSLVGASRDWRVAVADYQALYTKATLAAIADDKARQQPEVADVSEKLGLPVALEALQIPGLEFKRAQLLAFHGRPIAQFAYLDARGHPVAFCVTSTGDGDSAMKPETYGALQAMSWSKRGFGFIVIGEIESGTLRDAAQLLAKRI